MRGCVGSNGFGKLPELIDPEIFGPRCGERRESQTVKKDLSVTQEVHLYEPRVDQESMLDCWSTPEKIPEV